MGDGYNFEQLKAEILKRSQSGDWNSACTEWELHDIHRADSPETCLCGHKPIIEICTIRNHLNRKLANVGNVCVHKFMGIRSDLIFASVKRIVEDIENSINENAINFFHRRGVITEWERDFLEDTHRKRVLSPKQLIKRQIANQKVLSYMARDRIR